MGKRTLEIFRINTCLWGGKYNPIIPCFKQVPRWCDRHNHQFETAAQIVNGYLDFFEPDFLVEAEQGLADGLGFDKNRLLELPDLLTREGNLDRNGHGLSVLNLYRDLYQKEFHSPAGMSMTSSMSSPKNCLSAGSVPASLVRSL